MNADKNFADSKFAGRRVMFGAVLADDVGKMNQLLVGAKFIVMEPKMISLFLPQCEL